MIKLMADSTCDLSDDILEKYDISLAPLTITINGKDYKDRVDIQPDDFYGLLGALETLPTTAMPSPNEYLAIVDEAVAQGNTEILCINMSSGTSGSYQSAMLAREMFYEDHPDTSVRFEVIDSKSMSHGSGYLLMKCAMLREQGATFQEMIDFVETYKTNIKHFLSVEDLDNLIKSGRLTVASAMLGKMLKVRPIMSMRDAKGVIVGKVRGSKKVFSYYIDEFKKRNDPELTDFIIIGYTSDKTKAESLKLKIDHDTDFTGDIYMMQMGVSVGTHVGLGGLSMYFIEVGDRHDGLIFNEMHQLREKKNEMVAMVRKYRKEALEHLNEERQKRRGN